MDVQDHLVVGSVHSCPEVMATGIDRWWKPRLVSMGRLNQSGNQDMDWGPCLTRAWKVVFNLCGQIYNLSGTSQEPPGNIALGSP